MENCCSICISNENNTISLHNCGHVFCKECISPWIKSGKITCPNCRSLIVEEDYTKCELKYRSTILQEFINDAINYQNDQLVLLEEEYNDMITCYDEEDYIADIIRLANNKYHLNLLKNYNNIIKLNTTDINNNIRCFTQDDIEIINNMETTDIVFFHKLNHIFDY